MDNLITVTRMYRGCFRTIYEHQIDKLMARLILDGECWVSKTGTKLVVYINGVPSYGHILSHLWFNGDVPIGEEVCPTCDISSCCRPTHLWTGTHSENMIDCSKKGRARGGHNKHGNRWGDVMRKAWVTRRGY